MKHFFYACVYRLFPDFFPCFTTLHLFIACLSRAIRSFVRLVLILLSVQKYITAYLHQYGHSLLKFLGMQFDFEMEDIRSTEMCFKT